jgi:hypothetical protein
MVFFQLNIRKIIYLVNVQSDEKGAIPVKKRLKTSTTSRSPAEQQAKKTITHFFSSLTAHGSSGRPSQSIRTENQHENIEIVDKEEDDVQILTQCPICNEVLVNVDNVGLNLHIDGCTS